MDYQEGTKKAISFIELNLENDLSPEIVANEIGFSLYHFHRIFKAMMGETVADYIRKRRLANSARRLTSTALPILDIALEARFESQESFTRAFNKMFGSTPNHYRKTGIVSPIVGNETFQPELISHLRSGVTMEPNMVQRGEEIVVGMAGSFSEEPFNKISKLWDQFNVHAGEIPHQKPGYSLGVCMKSHPDCPLQAGDSFVYMAARPVEDVNDNIPAGMIVQKIPASRYAVFTHKGPLTDLPKTIRYIWGTWVPRNSELHKKDAPDFELYDERFDPDTLTGEFDIYIPIN